jgi:acetyl-CoA C-acetyltransferase
MPEAWIIDGTRTPRGKGKETGGLHGIHPQELLAQVLQSLVARTGIDPAEVDDVVIGNNENNGDHGSCIGRMAVLAAGWPDVTPGVTLNRFCGSGQQAVNFAAMGVMSGQQDLVVGGGVESMSRSVRQGRLDFSAGNEALLELHPLVPQGVSADLIATLEKFSRSDLDEFAVRSQDRAEQAQKNGHFDRSIIPVHAADGSRSHSTVTNIHGPGRPSNHWLRCPPSFERQGRRVPEGGGSTFDEKCATVYPEVGEVRIFTTRGTPLASSTAPGRSSWRAMNTRGPTAFVLVPESSPPLRRGRNL